MTLENLDICMIKLDIVLMVDDITHEQAVRNQSWINAMGDEMNSICRNETWNFVPLSPSTKPITTKWIYITKPILLGETPCLKARL